jgi:hypothetical protein
VHFFNEQRCLQIGENELLLEIFPKSSKSSKLKLAPFNKLEVTRYPNIDLNARKSKFKIGIFGQPDTDWTDEAIIEVGMRGRLSSHLFIFRPEW